MRAYLAKPAKAKGKLPLVLVVHENRGLNPHIEDIARRLALDNFIALAPDALFTLGGYPGDEDKARELFPKLDQAKTRNDFIAAEHYLRDLKGGNGKEQRLEFIGKAGQERELGLQHFQFDDHVAEQLALGRVGERAVIGEFVNFADVVQERARQQQVAIDLRIIPAHQIAGTEQRNDVIEQAADVGVMQASWRRERCGRRRRFRDRP